MLEDIGYTVKRHFGRGIPDFEVSGNSYVPFFVEVKQKGKYFTKAQLKRFNDIIKKGTEIYLAEVIGNEIIMYIISNTEPFELKISNRFHKDENLLDKGRKVCPRCGFEYFSMKALRCPNCESVSKINRFIMKKCKNCGISINISKNKKICPNCLKSFEYAEVDYGEIAKDQKWTALPDDS
jgi:rubrerythrin